MRHQTYVVPLLTLIVIVSFLLLGGGTAPVSAQQASRVVAISVGDVNGHVEILSRGTVKKGEDAKILSTAWKRATPKASLTVGDQIRTDVDASLQLHLNDGTLFTLGSDSLLTVEELKSARGETPRTAVFALEQGTVSTRQTSKILGQTVQIIRTTNGSVDTRLGEVEVYKPQQRYTKLAALPTQWPLFTQHSGDQDQTIVALAKGTAQIESTGTGQIVTTSELLPETCLGVDGVQFTLKAPKEKVKIAKLPDTNGFELISAAPFQLLVGTLGQANKIKIQNRADIAEVDIEGIDVAEMRQLSTLNLALNPLLTVGVQSTDMTVMLNCTGDPSKGIDFTVLGSDGNVTMLRNSLGGDISRNPSRGAIVPLRPTQPPLRTPTPRPTKTPEDGKKPKPTPTPKPGQTPAPTATPTPGGGKPNPTPIQPPVTLNQPRTPKILDPVAVNYALTYCSDANNTSGNGYDIDVNFDFENYVPSIMPGEVNIRVTDGNTTPYFSRIHSVTQGSVANYALDSTLLETGDITFSFCYTKRSALGDWLYFNFRVTDSGGNTSLVKYCEAELSGNNGTVYCP